jgi:serine/threonine-protein kinase HipA
LKIAEAFGLSVVKSEIHYFEYIKALVVERFDRKLSQNKTWLMRLPQEDMCQSLGISPNLKYQADGGPGIKEIMNLLLGSAKPAEDRDNFFRSQVLFWLLAAIDAHAKNFSLFIEPDGKYYLTTLYDILSAYPLIAKKQLHRQKIKMAMALKGESNHYHWYNIQGKHFLSAAKNANYSTQQAEIILDEMLGQVDMVIERISVQLPNTFPKKISQFIFDGMQAMKQRLIFLC